MLANDQTDEFSGPAPSWTFLTNHGLVLLCVAREPDIRLIDIAEQVGISMRAVQKIIAELVRTGYVTRVRCGRRNVYQIHETRSIRAPVESRRSVADLLKLVEMPK